MQTTSLTLEPHATPAPATPQGTVDPPHRRHRMVGVVSCRAACNRLRAGAPRRIEPSSMPARLLSDTRSLLGGGDQVVEALVKDAEEARGRLRTRLVLEERRRERQDALLDELRL